jgi:hypothetical protein
VSDLALFHRAHRLDTIDRDWSSGRLLLRSPSNRLISNDIFCWSVVDGRGFDDLWMSSVRSDANCALYIVEETGQDEKVFDGVNPVAVHNAVLGQDHRRFELDLTSTRCEEDLHHL